MVLLSDEDIALIMELRTELKQGSHVPRYFWQKIGREFGVSAEQAVSAVRYAERRGMKCNQKVLESR